VIQKKSSKTTGGEKKQNGGTKSHLFCDELRWIFWGFVFRVFDLPCLRNAQKRDKTKPRKMKEERKNKV
jgi:hypothetical protein